eukprot:4298878-Amphidinium_carterae.1
MKGVWVELKGSRNGQLHGVALGFVSCKTDTSVKTTNAQKSCTCGSICCERISCAKPTHMTRVDAIQRM